MEKIKIENLTFSYPQSAAPSLKNISLTAGRGEFVVICGKSGCGKSTLLRQIKPSIAPHGMAEGKIYFDGKPIEELTQREQAEQIGFVMQDPDNGIVCDKVWHELAFGLESIGCPTEEIRARVAEMASFFGIQDWFYKSVCELSGGQKQLLNLAAVMVMQPSVLILDEPTSQLDPIMAHDFLETVNRINKELGATVILCEHRLEEAVPLADRVAVMENGEILTVGTAFEVGRALKEKNSDMLDAMPTPMRVFYSVQSDERCPITVREGKEWLAKQKLSECPIEKKEIKNNSQTAVELENVWFRYEKNSPDTLKGLSLKVFKSEFYAIVGGNGAGKTTALSVICGINRPYRGKVNICGARIAVLPQNPQSLFSRKTVMLDLEDAAEDLGLSREEKAERIRAAVEFCELGELCGRHPYDLSGGEQQRAALAMVLLQRPEVLVLDEPTKGLDAHFKQKLAQLLKSLNASGVTVITVSHDIEFCARYADRCGMLFDGMIVSEGDARQFFGGKSFYTTAANRMSRGILKNAVLDSDIIRALGGHTETVERNKTGTSLYNKEIKPQTAVRSKKLTAVNIIFGTVFAALFAAALYLSKKAEISDRMNYAMQLVCILFLVLSCMNFIPQREFGTGKDFGSLKKEKISKRTVAAAAMILFLIPLTIFIGMKFWGGRKYYFISLLIIIETMIPFALVFEGRKPQPREVVIISVLCAIAVVGRAAFAALPQFKPVAAVVIISGICFGGKTGFLVGAVTGFVSNFYFGQGPWTPWQMFAFGTIGFIAGVVFQKGLIRKTRERLAVFGFFATILIYGGIINPASVLMYNAAPTREVFLAAYITGFPFDLIHGISTAFFLWFAAEPMCEKLERVKIKYGLI